MKRRGKESYETVRFAGMRSKSDKEGQISRSVGACFVNSDAETRRAMEQQAGLNAHLSKPVQPEVLFDTLESLIV